MEELSKDKLSTFIAKYYYGFYFLILILEVFRILLFTKKIYLQFLLFQPIKIFLKLTRHFYGSKSLYNDCLQKICSPASLVLSKGIYTTRLQVNMIYSADFRDIHLKNAKFLNLFEIFSKALFIIIIGDFVIFRMFIE